MNFKSFVLAAGVLTLGACGDGVQNPAQLKGANFIANDNGTPITLSFAADEMRINGRVVNIYNATYTASGDNIHFGDMLSTMMMGPENEMLAEQNYFQFMSTVEKYSLSNGRLTLRNADGREMVFNQVENLPLDGDAVETVEVVETDVSQN